MERKGMERFAPLSGLVFLVLAIASFVIGGDPPGTDDSTAEIVEYWDDKEGAQFASAILGVWAAAALVWFAASVREAVAKAEGRTGRLAAISFAGAVITAAGVAVGAAFQFTAADVHDDVPPEVLHTISTIYSDFFFPFALGNFLFLVAAGIAAVRHGAFDKRLAWIAIVIGVLSITPAGFFAFLAWIPWVGITAIVLYRQKDPVGSGAAPPPTSGPSIEVPPGTGPPSPS